MEALNFRVVKFFFRRFGPLYHFLTFSLSFFVRRFGSMLLRPFVLFSFLSFFLFCCKSGPPPGMTDPGELIYFGYTNQQAQCSRCHGEEGQGGMFGPKIRGAVQKFGVDSVRAIIANGKGQGDKRMPGLAKELTPLQIEQVIWFLHRWDDAPPADTLGTHDEH
jgi:hypothetical protein